MTTTTRTPLYVWITQYSLEPGMWACANHLLPHRFNPTDPNIIAAGCINGQLVLWDISQYEARLRNHKTSGARTNKPTRDIFDAEYQRSPVCFKSRDEPWWFPFEFNFIFISNERAVFIIFYFWKTLFLTPCWQVVHYAAVSSIESSHKMAIMGMTWLPDTLELARMGLPIENKIHVSST